VSLNFLKNIGGNRVHPGIRYSTLMKKFGLTFAVLFLPVAPVLGGQLLSAQDSNTLTVQMPSANDQAPAAQPTAQVQPPASAPAAPKPQASKDAGQSQPTQQDQPAAAPVQAPAAQGDVPKNTPSPAQDASLTPSPEAQDSTTPAVQTPAVAQDQVPAAGQPTAAQDQTATAQDAQVPAAKDAKSQTPEEIVAAAEKQADLLGGQQGAFELDVNFAVSMNRAMVGHMELRWESKDHWWRHIEMDNFTQTMMRNGGKIYTSSNVH
jgi:hypothetical protein